MKEQMPLFQEAGKPISKEDILKKKEEELCIICKKEKWTENQRCPSCLKIFYGNEFKKYGLTLQGFKDNGEFISFYSHTTGIEQVKKDRILKVYYDLMGSEIFVYCVQICDVYGLHENTFGITKDFGEFLIKTFNLKKQLWGEKNQIEFNGEKFHTEFLNPLIKQDEKAKEIAELEKEIDKDKKELTEKIIKLRSQKDKECKLH